MNSPSRKSKTHVLGKLNSEANTNQTRITTVTETILVIDDDTSFRRSITIMLEEAGYRVIEAINRLEGTELALTQNPDLVLSDIELGDGSGYEVLKAVRENTAEINIPFILMTGRQESEGTRRAMALGADDYLLKPFTAETLSSAVGARLNKHRAHKQQNERIQSLLLAILEATTDLVSIVDYNTMRTTYLNRAGRMMLGIGLSDEITQFRMADYGSPKVLDQWLNESIPQAIRDGVWSGEVTMKSINGEEIPISQVIVVHRGTDGSVEHFSTVARDISESKRTEDARRQMEIQLRHSQKLESIGQLAAGIAHEINTPTQYIGDNTNFLKDAFTEIMSVLKPLTALISKDNSPDCVNELFMQIKQASAKADLAYLMDEIPKAIQQSLEGVDRVEKIVRAMKEFSYPSTNEMTPFDLNRAIETTLTVCRNEWKYVAQVATDFDNSLPLVPCLPGEFNQIILNIVVNAAHAIADVVGDGSKGKGTIAVKTAIKGDWVEIRISDTGTGIPEKVRPRIFDPFFTTKGVGKGTGQGLAIAHVVVEKHGGTITFETEIGKGTTFIIRLPINGTSAVKTLG